MGARLSSDLLRLRLTSGWRLLGPAVSSELGVVARLWLVTVSEAAWPRVRRVNIYFTDIVSRYVIS